MDKICGGLKNKYVLMTSIAERNIDKKIETERNEKKKNDIYRVRNRQRGNNSNTN